jgi:hypothetical protein
MLTGPARRQYLDCANSKKLMRLKRCRIIRPLSRLLGIERKSFAGCDSPAKRKQFPKRADVFFPAAGAISQALRRITLARPSPGSKSRTRKPRRRHVSSTVETSHSSFRTQPPRLEIRHPRLSWLRVTGNSPLGNRGRWLGPPFRHHRGGLFFSRCRRIYARLFLEIRHGFHALIVRLEILGTK